MVSEEQTNWREIAQRAREKLAEAQEFIQQVTSPPFVYGTVIGLNGESVDVDVGGKVMELSFVGKVKDQLRAGTAVRLNPETYAVIDVRSQNKTGVLSTVEEVLENGSAVVNDSGKRQVLRTSSQVQPGDRIIVDAGYHTVLTNLGKKSNLHHVAAVPVVPWSKVGGLEQTIEALKEDLEKPFVHREVYTRYGKKAPKGILLYGPPGCGKTLIAKAIAYNLTEMARKEGRIDGGNGYFFSVKGPEFKSMWYGESERGIREFFAQGRDGAKRHGLSVGFLDEAEALIGKRGTKLGGGHIDDSLVTQFNAEMDGLDDNGNFIVVLATNRPDIIDDAILRPGRIDRKIRVGRPNKDAALNIYQIHLSGMPVYQENSAEDTTEELARYASEEMFSDRYPLFSVTFQGGDKQYIQMGEVASGAMIESIAQRAAGKAIKREIGGDQRKGLVRKDLQSSIGDEYQESRGLVSFDEDDLRIIFPSRYKSIVQVTRVYEGRDGN